MILFPRSSSECEAVNNSTIRFSGRLTSSMAMAFSQPVTAKRKKRRPGFILGLITRISNAIPLSPLRLTPIEPPSQYVSVRLTSTVLTPDNAWSIESDSDALISLLMSPARTIWKTNQSFIYGKDDRMICCRTLEQWRPAGKTEFHQGASSASPSAPSSAFSFAST